MIRFNFIVEDADAENLFDLINSQIRTNKEHINKLIYNHFAGDNVDVALIDGYKKDIEYLTQLKQKMTNVRI